MSINGVFVHRVPDVPENQKQSTGLNVNRTTSAEQITIRTRSFFFLSFFRLRLARNREHYLSARYNIEKNKTTFTLFPKRFRITGRAWPVTVTGDWGNFQNIFTSPAIRFRGFVRRDV